MKRRRHLSIDEIVKIHTLKRSGVSIGEIQKRFDFKTRKSVYNALGKDLKELINNY